MNLASGRPLVLHRRVDRFEQPGKLASHLLQLPALEREVDLPRRARSLTAQKIQKTFSVLISQNFRNWNARTVKYRSKMWIIYYTA